MSIVINKDGLQLGPYSLEQARALVLEGTIDADDWAWPDGATEWVQLRNVPGFTAAKAPPAKPAAPAQPLTAVSAAVAELTRARMATDLAEARLLLARAQLAAGLAGAASESAAAPNPAPRGTSESTLQFDSAPSGFTAHSRAPPPVWPVRRAAFG